MNNDKQHLNTIFLPFFMITQSTWFPCKKKELTTNIKSEFKNAVEMSVCSWSLV